MNEDKKFRIGGKGENTFYEKVLQDNKQFEVGNPDLIVLYNGKLIIIENKNKEHFEAPPFDGHGLDYSQYLNRLKLWKEHKIRCLLAVQEKHTAVFYVQWLDELAKGKHHYNDKSYTIVFPLTNFIATNIDELKEKFEEMVNEC